MSTEEKGFASMDSKRQREIAAKGGREFTGGQTGTESGSPSESEEVSKLELGGQLNQEQKGDSNQKEGRDSEEE